MNRLFKTVVLTGSFVGTMDLANAYIAVGARTGKFPAEMLNYIAGGALGLDTALHGGTPAAFLGLFFHYFIAFAYTLFFFLVFPYVTFLRFDKYLVGMLYAVFVNVTMGQIVLRLSRLPVGPFNLPHAVPDWMILGIVFGIPIAYNAYKHYGVSSTAAAAGDGR